MPQLHPSPVGPHSRLAPPTLQPAVVTLLPRSPKSPLGGGQDTPPMGRMTTQEPCQHNLAMSEVQLDTGEQASSGQWLTPGL